MMVMCCLFWTLPYLWGEWYMIMGQWWIED
jgi:hypothetical protein